MGGPDSTGLRPVSLAHWASPATRGSDAERWGQPEIFRDSCARFLNRQTLLGGAFSGFSPSSSKSR